MNKEDKIYAKVFKVTNKEGTFTKEDFNVFEENFELVRFFFYTELNERDCFDSFNEIIGEIKRAAWAAGLKARVLDIKYNASCSESGITVNEVCVERTVQHNISLSTDKEDDEYNMIIFFKCGKNYEKEKNFVITKIEVFETPRAIRKDHITVITVDEDCKDAEDLTYKYVWRK